MFIDSYLNSQKSIIETLQYENKRLLEENERLKIRADEYRNEMMYDAEALAILHHAIFSGDINGEIKEEFLGISPIVDKALKQAQYRHVWVVCGPSGHAMEKLINKWQSLIDE